MSENHYCLECQKLIEEGKEVKIEKESSRRYNYHSTWSRGNIFVFLVLKSNKRKCEQKRVKIEFISHASVEE